LSTSEVIPSTCPRCGEVRLRHFRICRACGLDIQAAIEEEDPRLARRLGNRIRRQPAEYLVAAGIGLFCAWAVLQSFGGSAGWKIPPVVAASVVVGCPLVAEAIALTGLVQRLVRRGAYFWGGVLPAGSLAGAYAFMAASFYACASIAWGMAMVMLFGSK